MGELLRYRTQGYLVNDQWTQIWVNSRSVYWPRRVAQYLDQFIECYGDISAGDTDVAVQNVDVADDNKKN